MVKIQYYLFSITFQEDQDTIISHLNSKSSLPSLLVTLIVGLRQGLLSTCWRSNTSNLLN